MVSLRHINASDAGFVVDNKIDFTVTTVDSAIVEVTPGQSNAVLTYLVTNTGNTVQDFSLTSTLNNGNPFGETDNFDATVSIFVDSNGNGVYDSGTDIATFIDELSPDANVTVFLVSDISLTRTNSDVSEHTLVAQVAVGGGAGLGADITTDDSGSADVASTVQTVFADGNGTAANGGTDSSKDGKFSIGNAFKVISADLSMSKTSIVISDPVNSTTNPHRIPGATIRYCFVVDNNGSTDSNSTLITDSIDANLTYVNSGFVTGSIAVACDCPNIANTAGTNNHPGANDVEISIGDMTGAKDSNTSSRACAYIEATID